MRCLTLSLLGLGAAACAADRDIPEDSQIRCGGAAECPEAFRCEASIGLCVPVDVQGAGPQVVSSTLGPPVVGLAQDIDLTFSLDRPLAIPPAVNLRLGATDKTLLSSGGTWQLVVTKTGGAGDVTLYSWSLRNTY